MGLTIGASGATLPGMDEPRNDVGGPVDSEPHFMVRLADGREFGPATMPTIEQWAREGRVPMEALLVPRDGSQVRSVLTEPSLRVILRAPPTVAASGSVAAADDGPLSGMIPYRNPQALIGYYTAIASLIPFLGAIAGPVAIVLGIIGIRNYKKEPRVRGLAHAWIAIIVGVIGLLISASCFANIFIGMR